MGKWLVNKLDDLISAIETNETVKRFKTLHELVTHDEVLLDKYQKFLYEQRQMVSKKNSMSKEEYDLKLQELTDDPIISEYLMLVEEVNYLASEINKILNFEESLS